LRLAAVFRHLSTVRLIAVTIAPARHTFDLANAAVASCGTVLAGTNAPAVAAVLRIAIEVSVAVPAVSAVAESGVAGRYSAHAVAAASCPAVRRAGKTAGAAVRRVRVNVGLAAVVGVEIAIGETWGACRGAALNSGGAGAARDSVLVDAGDVATAAVFDRVEAGFTAIFGYPIAIA
jgi:hypothetical protein